MKHYGLCSVKRAFKAIGLCVLFWCVLTGGLPPVRPVVVMAEEPTVNLSSEERIPDVRNPDLNHSVFGFLTDRLKPGDTRILRNPQEVEDFFAEVYGTRDQASWHDNSLPDMKNIHFDVQVIVAVATKAQDSCTRYRISAVERNRDDLSKITVTVEDWGGEVCGDPKPWPDKWRYVVIAEPIEHPVSAVDVIYTSKFGKYPPHRAK